MGSFRPYQVCSNDNHRRALIDLYGKVIFSRVFILEIFKKNGYLLQPVIMLFRYV